MTNEQLLELAELHLKSAHKPNLTTDQSLSSSQISLSASLLVIARNSEKDKVQPESGVEE